MLLDRVVNPRFSRVLFKWNWWKPITFRRKSLSAQRSTFGPCPLAAGVYPSVHAASDKCGVRSSPRLTLSSKIDFGRERDPPRIGAPCIFDVDRPRPRD